MTGIPKNASSVYFLNSLYCPFQYPSRVTPVFESFDHDYLFSLVVCHRAAISFRSEQLPLWYAPFKIVRVAAQSVQQSVTCCAFPIEDGVNFVAHYLYFGV